ncbi:ribonuclease III [Pompano iridovirus]|uniref:Ribonuclease III n=1 Tax=Pompano iridovirus TaxID=2494350 RepID=A0A3Q9EGD9_ISKNV|nr:ribonuclease III [Pompano iridovirus]AZQ21076.1 ribonuclease III [Pompano iridovirus]
MTSRHTSGAMFKAFIVDFILVRCCEMDRTFAQTMYDKNTQVFHSVFTHSKAHPVNNYEWYEKLGDAIIASVMPQYYMERFPKLAHDPSAIVARTVSQLAITYQSGTTMSTIAQKMGFLKWVVAHRDGAAPASYKEQQRLLEDTFEAMVGAISITMDDATGVKCSGHIACYRFLKYAYGLINMTLDGLIDNKSMLKELIDMHSSVLDSFTFEYTNNVMTLTVAHGKYTVSEVNVNNLSKRELEKVLAGKVLAQLASDGYVHKSIRF